MCIKFNRNELEKICFNGNEINEVYFNGNKVYESTPKVAIHITARGSTDPDYPFGASSYIKVGNTTYYNIGTISVDVGQSIGIYGKSNSRGGRVGTKVNSEIRGTTSQDVTSFNLLYTYTVTQEINIKLVDDESDATVYVEITTL